MLVWEDRAMRMNIFNAGLATLMLAGHGMLRDDEETPRHSANEESWQSAPDYRRPSLWRQEPERDEKPH